MRRKRSMRRNPIIGIDVNQFSLTPLFNVSPSISSSFCSPSSFLSPSLSSLHSLCKIHSILKNCSKRGERNLFLPTRRKKIYSSLEENELTERKKGLNGTQKGSERKHGGLRKERTSYQNE